MNDFIGVLDAAMRRSSDDGQIHALFCVRPTAFEEMADYLDDAMMYGPVYMDRLRRAQRAKQRIRKRRSRYNRGRMGVRPRSRFGR